MLSKNTLRPIFVAAPVGSNWWRPVACPRRGGNTPIKIGAVPRGDGFGQLNEKIAQIGAHDILETSLSDDVKFEGM